MLNSSSPGNSTDPGSLQYFEQRADVQMLALMTCVLSQGSVEMESIKPIGHASGAQLPNHTAHGSPDDWEYVDSDQKPGATFNFFELTDVMLGTLKRPLTQMGAAAERSPMLHRAGHQSSFDSDAIWSSDGTEVDRQGSYQTNVSPQDITRQGFQPSQAGAGHSYGSSSDDTMKRSQSMLSTRLAASLSRPFSFITSGSASPPSQSRTPELSTSAPSSGLDEGKQHSRHRERTFDDASSLQRVESRSSLAYEIDVQSIEDADIGSDKANRDDDWDLVCYVDNVDAFEETCPVPLLDPSREPLYAAWREAYAHLLYVWQLPYKRAEILKFNSELAKPDVSGSQSAMRLSNPQQASTSGQQQSGRLYCSVCYGAIASVFSSCLVCGHASHETCLDMLSEADPDLQLNTPAIGCKIGCGCGCPEFSGEDGDIEDSLQAQVRRELGRPDLRD